MSSQTTAPASATGPDSSSDELAVRWLHPRPLPDTWLSQAVLTLGRHEDNQVVLDGTTTSRFHARLLKKGSALAIEDLGGQNGVYCNGQRIERFAPLLPGNVLRVGAWVSVVVRVTSRGNEKPAPGFRELVPDLYGSETLQSSLDLATRLAVSELSLLLEAETGTGKELVARAIHTASGRKGRLVPVNCAALADSLAEAGLFGHERGAFTGADRARPGLIREAEHGTLFLDEIADLSLTAQAKLLRAIQEREVAPIGAARVQHVDFRVISATHRPLAALVKRGEFRSDLYARLQGAVVRLPPLRDRREDILPLFLRFAKLAGLSRVPRLSVRFVEALCIYDWPMNVRQLKAIAERITIMHPARSEWRRRHLREVAPEMFRDFPEQESSRPPYDSMPLSPREAEPSGHASDAPEAARGNLDPHRVLTALEAAHGNVTQAARLLGVSKQTVYRLIKTQQIDIERFRAPADSG